MQIRLRTPAACAPEQLGLNTENVAVAAAEVQHRLDAGLLLDQHAGDLRAHPGARARPVRHVDAIDAVRRAQLGAFDFARGVHAARRQNLDEGDELRRRPAWRRVSTFRPPAPWPWACALAAGCFHRDRRVRAAPAAASALRARISLMWSGVVPQQPPITFAPAQMKRRAYCAMYSGEER